jgi:hypothetical protein
MPPLTDPVILGQFQTVLANWKYTGYVTAKDVALEWMANELKGLKLKDVAKAMHDVLQGGESSIRFRKRARNACGRAITAFAFQSPAATFPHPPLSPPGERAG